MPLVNAKEMTKKAFEGQYAVPQMNINNLEWTKSILEACEEVKSPIILGVSEGAMKYMGGWNTIAGMVKGLMKDLKITIPVALHLDHGSYEATFKALEAGFTSVMFDGSHFPFEENMKKSKEVLKAVKKHKASLEVEVGTLGGEEDGIIGTGEFADPEEVRTIATINPDMIAAGIGNIHGPYPEDWTTLSFETLAQLKDAAGRAIVLHGGTGIPEDQIKRAISMGVAKINVNTELQLVNAAAIKEFVASGKIDEGKNYDPRKINAVGIKAIKEAVIFKVKQFGSDNKA